MEQEWHQRGQPLPQYHVLSFPLIYSHACYFFGDETPHFVGFDHQKANNRIRQPNALQIQAQIDRLSAQGGDATLSYL
jgi:hypothetical protein